MALTTYAELQAAIADYLARSDLTTQIVDYITLFEAAANRRLRVRQMETTTSLTPSSGSATLPTDYLTWRRATWQGSTHVELEYVNPSYLEALYPDSPTDTPCVFTIEGTTFKIRPLSTTAIQFDYFQKISALSSSVNWLYAAHPDVYLFGSLAEAYAMLKDFDTASVWKGRRDEVFDEIEKLSVKTVGPAAIRIMGITP